MRLGKPLFMWLFVFALASCVTVNVYFPAAAVQQAADTIVEGVRKTPEHTPPPQPEQKQNKGSYLDRFRLVLLGPTEAHAAVNLDVSTPAIRAIRAAMANRFPQLRPFYGKGAIGETNNGYVATRDTGGLSLKKRADLTRLVEQENTDRRALYTEIIKANNLNMGSLGEVERLFANSWRGQSPSGWWIQQDNGQWAKK